MKPGGGKAKGAAFEREVCRLLSEWISNNKRDDLFWRSAMSGGRATVGKKSGKERQAQAGDISGLIAKGDIHEKRAAVFLGMVVVECKSLDKVRFWHFIMSCSGPIRDAWEQCKVDDLRSPFLVIKQNRRKPFVVTSYDVLGKFGIEPPIIRQIDEHNDCVILDLETFLKTANPRLLK